jgi:soluble lytic murein transglycosylase-like protein
VRYLLAQSHENQKQTKQAQTLYEEIQQELPLSYYGFLSASKTTKSIDSVIDPNLPLATDSDSALQPQDIVHLTRAKQFLAAEIPDLASYELKELRSYESLSSPFLVYVAMLNQKAGNYRQCFGIFGELLQRGYPGVLSYYLFQMAFPMIFVETINKYSIENNIDPILIISVIKQESAFDEDANSGVGAMGLMQLMPYTALEIEPRANLSDLLTAEKSIQIGTKYLKKLLTRFNGNIILALAAYNAGPNAVDRWVKDLGTKRASLDFIESIPYKQTREYVSSIIRNYYWYSRRFKKTAPRRIDYFWNPASYQKQEGLQEPPFPSPLPSPTQQSGNA